MRYLLSCAALALVGSVLVACGDKGGFVGTWTFDVAGSRKALEASLPAGADKSMLDAMIQMMEKGMDITIEIKSDSTWTGKFRMEMMGQSKTTSGAGTWRGDGSKVFLKSTEEDGVKKDGEEKSATLKDGKLYMEMAPGQEMVLKRK
jgi:hypothetical protein